MENKKKDFLCELHKIREERLKKDIDEYLIEIKKNREYLFKQYSLDLLIVDRVKVKL